MFIKKIESAARMTQGLLSTIPGVKVNEWNKSEGTIGWFHICYQNFYWVVDGKVPISIARQIYSHPEFGKKIRVNGDLTCPAPDAKYDNGKYRGAEVEFGRLYVKNYHIDGDNGSEALKYFVSVIQETGLIDGLLNVLAFQSLDGEMMYFKMSDFEQDHFVRLNRKIGLSLDKILTFGVLEVTPLQLIKLKEGELTVAWSKIKGEPHQIVPVKKEKNM